MPKRKNGHRRPWALLAFLVVAALLLATCGYMFVKARTVHIRYATVWLEDLPEAFDGKRILYMSDIDLQGANRPSSAKKLLSRLNALEPDMLLLGGDYATSSLLERLNSGGGTSQASLERQVDDRSAWMASLADFTPSLGKYAVAGEADQLPEALRLSMDSANIKLLEDNGIVLTQNDQKLAIVGLKDAGAEPRSPAKLAAKVRKGDCVIVLAHNPTAFVGIQTAEASDGGPWADLVLSGHTHGGQIMFFGRSVFTLEEYEQKYLSGWRRENGVAMLTSCGVGCVGANLRLGTEAEVHMITLRRGSPPAQAVAPIQTGTHWQP